MKKRVLSFLLTLLILCLSFPAPSSCAEEEHVYLLAASDFQEGSHDGSAAIVSSICNSVRSAGFTNVSGFLFAGDYDRNNIGNLTESQNGLNKLDETVSAKFPSLTHKVYVQGNHDPANTAGLSPSGENDTEDYGVFVIHNDDYMWFNSNEERIKETAGNLRAYLSEKEDAGFTKPIFVVAHLPLHYSMRTVVDGDAQFANYIFDELNEGGAMGLNIVYLYGHDHSHGWDNYLGGASVCLLPGDNVEIAQASRSEAREETLTFTYMNAGYTGYYSSENGADSCLTMCLFDLCGDRLTISRFDEDGLHALKSAGTFNSEYDDRALLPSNATVYESPRTLVLSDSVLEKGWFEDDAFGIAVRTTGVGIEVSEHLGNDVSDYFEAAGRFSSYAAFDVDVVGENVGKADLALPLDLLDEENARVYLEEDGSFVRVQTKVENGRARFPAKLPATVVLASCANPYANSDFGGTLWRAEADGASWTFFNYDKQLYLGCGSNATVSETPARLTVTAMTGGSRLALSEATGSKAAGDSLHFGTANRCSFGEASPFSFYEYVENDLFRSVSELEDGKDYLIVYKNGSNSYLLTGIHNSDRLETELKVIPLIDGDDPQTDVYGDLLYEAERSGSFWQFKHAASGLYLGCGGNASLSETPAKFALTSSSGAFTVALAEAIGGKSAGDALHLGSGNRISYGTASPVRFFEYVGEGLFKEISAMKEGARCLIVFGSGGTDLALTGNVYNSGSSSRIETQALTVPLCPVLQKGDLDGDGILTIADVTLLLNCLAGLEPAFAPGADADVSGNGTVNINDVSSLLNTLSAG